ncbi:ral guanine nucleotide dissociation stimulator-like 1 isoform X1 [Coregonus clupeaformis]|uniref:ral guanine nucleotide dissociation stimulator-like 1 isoform X1 n=1 Tax=Coregonus clupeaformis TaxID=59861 RepID=UPI001E1C808C|nr:ral guanine nucleotide dissociation stimulator-like 1 isoform X1 [Coregonus clupeaformis]XP_041723321.2 ral guanine nucleotide dissociation stimulator-like 1 isoform X1 [Coregonus clupeaformis]XP_041723322.2 ral guanine nucleotide dissociation stimulator-like 1 isoform X1 [Coregonus clupeaformis]
MRMRSTLSLCGGEGDGRGLRARVGRMKRLLCLRHTHRVDVLTDMEPGVWLRHFQLLDTEVTEDPVQEWGEEVEEGAVFGITLCREPVLPSPSTQDPSDPLAESPSTPSAFNFIQYHTVKVRRLKAGTLERLVTHLLDSKHQEADYVRVFLSTYRAFTTTNTLIELLFQRDDMIANLDNTVCPRSTLVPLIRTWLEEHREDFREPPRHPSLRLLCLHLRHRLAFRRLAHTAETLLKKLQEEDRTSLDQSAPIDNSDCQQKEEGSGEEVPKEEETGDFMDFPVIEVAEQLTRLDAELFIKVVPFQCLGCVWSQRDKKESRNVAPTVRATIAQFNAVTNRVITSLLCPSSTSPNSVSSSTPSLSTAPSSPLLPHTSPTLRARVIERWIAIAQECRTLKNFSSLRAILSALQSNAVYRLKKTWAAVNRDCMACFDQLCETFPDENCVMTSREILVEDGSQPDDNATPKSPRLCPMSKQMSPTSGVVPYLGTYLTVLTMLDTALTDTVEGGLINFEKRRREFEILSQIGQLQAFCSCYSLPVDQTISAWLQNHTMLNDQESYELSRALEHPVDPCPNSPSSWSHRLLAKKLASLLSVTDVSSRKTHSDQISVSSSGSSGSEMEDLSSPQPLRDKLKSLSGSLHNVSEELSSNNSSPTPSNTSCSSSQPDLSYSSMAMSPDCSSSSASSCFPSSSPQCCKPVYNKQVADSCIVRVSVECGNNGNVYKSILLTSQDHTPQVIQRALEKHNLENMSCTDFGLTQLLAQDKELQIPDKANVFYAMSTSANYDFVLRQRWRSHSRCLGTSSSPGPQARARHAK